MREHRPPPKPCLRCQGPKPKGRGIKFCPNCLEPCTLMEFIADQAADMRRGQQVDRQRFGVTSALRARTVSLDVVREVCPDEYWDTQVDGYDEWADPTADAALRRIDGEDVTHAQH